VLSEPIDIRAADPEDLGRLADAFDDEPESLFAEQVICQGNGGGLLALACSRGRPVGHVYLRLAEAEEEDLRRHLPGVPVLSQLRVHRAYRNARIGTALIDHVEDAAIAAGRTHIALGVSLDNQDARRLYLRLGYLEWDHGIVETRTVTIKEGREVCMLEKCEIMVKDLRAHIFDHDHCSCFLTPRAPAIRAIWSRGSSNQASRLPL